ncbi:MAG: hypothetical protein COT16_00935 [Elusimicrobia bacterium CG08_land_8_20_14_0_20_44_26]|nr:MAG: hypothetical protein COT16_00935 [Elusimicrobia bacterium CG08_land_8_20_14_0_20_44_26]
MKILIIQSAFIGDVVLTLPLVEAVKQTAPSVEIQFLTLPAYEHFLEKHPAISKVIVDDKKGGGRSPVNFLKLCKRLKNEKFDEVLIPHRSFRSGLLARLSGIKKRTGFDNAAGSIFYTGYAHYNKSAHEADRNLALGKAAGFGKWNGKWNLPFNPNFKTGFLIRRKPLITMSPFSKWGTKRWIFSHWAKVINELAPIADIAVIGSSSDAELWEEIKKEIKSEVGDFVGKTDFLDLAALVRQSDLLITGDSAPAHFASAFGIKTVVIFGPTVPEFGFGPYGGSKNAIVEINLACRPCSIHGPQKCPLGHHDCMKKITPEKVLEAVEKLLLETG